MPSTSLLTLKESDRFDVKRIDHYRQWKILSTADFGEEGYATPAILDGKIYLRTAGHMYCFAKDGGK